MIRGIGREGLIWYEGVVEDNSDPLGIGRCRVRALGWDTEDRQQLPTSDLPWAYPMLPLNNSSIAAIKPGTWVIGFFRDGESAQDRVMLGTINTGLAKRITTQ